MPEMRIYALSLFLCVSAVKIYAYFPADRSERLETIVFGSCNRGDLPQPLWPIISNYEPDLFIWGGDNVYGDWHPNLGTDKPHPPFDREYIAQQYAHQFERQDYRAFREHTPILGTWDDHDYGLNNANGSFALRDLTRDMALAFMEVPISDLRWQRPGLYGAYTFGPIGEQTCIILLDNRYFKTSRDAENPTILGSVQESWLETTLRSSNADLHIIVSGTQVLPTAARFERWANYPEARRRLIDLVAEVSKPMTLFLSGDRHFHEITVLNDNRLDYPLVDVTSSGMTHPWYAYPGEANELRHGEVLADIAFGLLEIDWTGDQPTVTAKIIDRHDVIQNEYAIKRDGSRRAPQSADSP